MKDIHETPEYQKAQKAISDYYDELNGKIDEMRVSDAKGDCKTMEDQYKEVKALLDDMQKEGGIMELIDRVEIRKPVDGVGKVARDLLYQQFQTLKKSGRDIAGEIRNKYQPSYINSMQGIIKLDNVLQILGRIKKCGLAKGAPLGNRNAAKDHVSSYARTVENDKGRLRSALNSGNRKEIQNYRNQLANTISGKLDAKTYRELKTDTDHQKFKAVRNSAQTLINIADQKLKEELTKGAPLGNRNAAKDYEPKDNRAKQVEEFQSRMTAAQSLAEDVKSTGQRLTINADGSVNIFHGTSSNNASKIKEGGQFNSQSFFAPSAKATEPHAKPKHGKDTEIIQIKADPRSLSFSSGSGEIYVERELKRNPQTFIWE